MKVSHSIIDPSALEPESVALIYNYYGLRVLPYLTNFQIPPAVYLPQPLEGHTELHYFIELLVF